LLLFLFSGCVFEEKDQSFHFLMENTCIFPCWMGITPGETTYSELDTKLGQLVQTFAEYETLVTYEEKMFVGGSIYFEVLAPGSKVFVILDQSKVVNEISIIFLNQPTVKEFTEKYRVPDSIGVCMSFRRAVPVLVYEGMRVYLVAKLPNYNDATKTITIENFYGEKVRDVSLESTPDITHFQYTFSWEEMTQTVIIDTNKPDPNADCKEQYLP